MKTKTYARLALLIPLLIWVILIFVELANQSRHPSGSQIK